MKYDGKNLQQALAAEYVLGTLTGPARRRFAKLLKTKPALVNEVGYWEKRLAGFNAHIAPVTPRERVWAHLDRAINASAVSALTAKPSGALAQNLWRGWALAASVAAAYFGYNLNLLQNQAPQIVEKLVPFEKIVQVPVEQPMPYMAVLQPGGDSKFTLALSPEKGLIRVSIAGKAAVDYRKNSLELWVIGDDAKPHSLGVLPEAGEGDMPMPKGVAMPVKPTLAVSLEPRGGSTTGLPTGPVITTGTALRL